MSTNFTTRIDGPSPVVVGHGERSFARAVPRDAPNTNSSDSRSRDASPPSPVASNAPTSGVLVRHPSSMSFSRLRELLEESSEREGTLFQCMSRFCQLACEATNGLTCLLARVDLTDESGAGENAEFPGHPSVVVLAEHNALANSSRGLKQEVLRAAAGNAVKRNQTLLIDDGPIAFLAVPIGKAKERPRDCLSVALHLGDQPREPFLAMIHLVATYVERWHHRQVQSRMIRQAEHVAAAAELLAEITRAASVAEAEGLLVNQLAQHLGARTIVLGRRRKARSRRIALSAISDHSTIDPNAELTTLMTDALEEAMIRQEAVCIPDEAGALLTRAHQRLHRELGGCSILTQPIGADPQDPIGVLLCVVEPSSAKSSQRFLQAAQSLLAEGLESVRRANQSAVRRTTAASVGFFNNHRFIASVVSIVALAALCFLPVPHRIRCEASLEPLERAYAVAPFDGLLKEALVSPGELVEVGQRLAVLDDRDLQLELSDAGAERRRLIKKRDVYQSERNAAAVAITTLEIEKVDSRIQLLESRLAQVEITSRLRGLVLEGDLEAMRNAPVRTGEMLYEVAPIQQLQLHIKVPEESLRFVEREQHVTVLLDGFPNDEACTQIDKIRPISTVFGGQNVFVCEASFNNKSLQFRPGMQALAKIDAGQRALGWVLFHRAWERTRALLY